MSDDTSYHMTPAEFRRVGKQVVDWVADYYENIESYPVLSQVAPGEVRGLLPAEAPRPVLGVEFSGVGPGGGGRCGPGEQPGRPP